MPPLAVPVTPVGLASAASVVFRDNGVLLVTAIVKASFTFAPRGGHEGGHQGVQLAAPEPIFSAEAHRMNNPTRSVSATSDLVPRMPGADVLLLGHAHGPGGSATHGAVRLAVGRGESTLLDKTVHVVGDRKGSEVKPFQTIPLVHEKAFGGPGFRDNPLGTGVLAGDPLPNLIDPQAPDRAACFAPISRTWPARTALLGPDARAALDQPVAELAAGFDLRYFHAAPADQRLDHLLGDEWILLEGVHAEVPQIHFQLPNAQALVRVLGIASDSRVFSLRADTLRIDADAGRCTIVWRNSFPVRESELGSLHLLAGVALPGAPITWPDPAELAAPPARVPQPSAGRNALQGAGGTLVLDDQSPLAATFGGTMEISDEDLESVHIEPADDEPDFGSTLVLVSPSPPTARLPATFFHAQVLLPPTATPPIATSPIAKPAIAARSVARPARDPMEGTLDLNNDSAVAGRSPLPFAGKTAGERETEGPRNAGPIPGSPWDATRNRRSKLEDSVTFDINDSPLAGTLVTPTGPVPSTPEPAPRVHTAPLATWPAQIEIRTMDDPPSIFEHSAPDSAPTGLRPLAPLAPDLEDAPSTVVLQPAPSPPETEPPPRAFNRG